MSTEPELNTASSYKNKIKNTYHNVKTYLTNSNNSSQIITFVGGFLFILCIIIYALSKVVDNTKSYMKPPVKQNSKMNSSVGGTSNPTPITRDSCGNIIYVNTPADINFNDHKGTYNVNDYYIYGSYNSCNMSGTVKNNVVSTTALVYVISQGVRFIDFEIYNLNGEPIIATSSQPTNYYIKESYTYVTFSDAMETLVTNAFSFTGAPNYSDPIFLQLRIKSTDCNMMDKMIEIFNKYESRLLNAKYNYTYQTCVTQNNSGKQVCSTNNLGNLPLYIFQNKIVIIADLSNKDLPECSRFMELVNMTSYSIYLRILTNYDMVNTPDQSELLEFNKRSMTVVTPDVGSNPMNPDSNISTQLGVQIVAPDFSINDQNLSVIKELFLEYAFILKPEDQRYQPVILEVPPPNPSSYNYSPRSFSVVSGTTYNI